MKTKGILALALLLLACGSPSSPASAAPAGPAEVPVTPPSSPSPSPSATPEATQTPAPVEATPVPQPDLNFVGFNGFAPGTYPVHLHRICNGLQGFHLAYLPYLTISAAGTGGITVPAGDFGQGWCVVVYANRVATVIAAYRPI